MFRNDVAYLTKETSSLIDELQISETARKQLDKKVKDLEKEITTRRLSYEKQTSDFEQIKKNEQKLLIDLHEQKKAFEELRQEKLELMRHLTCQDELYKDVCQEVKHLKEKLLQCNDEESRQKQQLRAQIESLQRELESANDQIKIMRCSKTELNTALQDQHKVN